MLHHPAIANTVLSAEKILFLWTKTSICLFFLFIKMYINDLPIEILSQILSKVSNMDEVYECMNVCRLWRRKMVSTYYESPIIRQKHDMFLKHVQTKIFNTNNRIGDFVKTLTFGEEIGTPGALLSRAKFELLIFILPSLKAIRFHRLNVHRTVKYMEYLDRIAPYTKLQEVSIDCYMPEYVNFKRTSQVYYSIQDQLKHRITTLSIVDTSVKFKTTQAIFNYIGEFAKLKRLIFYNMDTQPGYREDIGIATVLNACCNNLEALTLESSSFAYAPGDHKYHYNLASLTLLIPEISEDHFAFLVEYAPNLKELDVVCGHGCMLETVYASLQPDILPRFTRYMKQLQRCRFYSSVYGGSPNMDVFWQTIEGIYNGQAFGNLVVSFASEHVYQYQTIFYDTQTFNVDCDFETNQFNDSIARGFQFLNLNSVSVSYPVRWLKEWRGVQNTPIISDLLDYAVSQQQQPQLNLVMDDQQIILCAEPVVSPVYKVGHEFPKDRSLIRYAYFSEVNLNKDLLDKIGSYYPTIMDLKLINCRIRKQDKETGHYVIDLKKFKKLQTIMFEFKETPILFHWDNGEQENYYIYDESVSENAIYSTKLTDTAKDLRTIAILSVEVPRLVFQRYDSNIEIINQ